MAYTYECHTCGMYLTADTEDQMVDAMIRHAEASHNLKLAVTEAKQEARQRARLAETAEPPATPPPGEHPLGGQQPPRRPRRLR